jgi:hypothetical protein
MADPLVRNFILNDNLVPDLIEIPKEFEDLSIEDVTPESYRKSSVKNRKLRHRSNKLLTGYDAWRSFDRSMFKGSG